VARPGLIVDRDGTIVEERGYISRAEDLVVMPWVAESLSRARAAGAAVVVVTNQSAVARGIVTEEGLGALHESLRPLGIDAFYVCPHMPDAGCECRKPKPTLILRAIADHDLDPARSMVVGDHLGDCLAGRAAGLPAILVRSGHGADHAAEAEAEGFGVADDLSAAVDRFLEHIGSEMPS
jgi:D-glycero-D-manno-heptose 1,7-bisphosphate phosphatase